MKNNIIDILIKKHKLPVLHYENYTSEIAKIIKIKKTNKRAKLIVVTAMNPNKLGEGKTTTSIGLVDGLNALGLKTVGVLREPSLGPVFGMKGTGSGSNKAKLLPFDKINLHFTGDLHAIATANNLIAAIIENEIYFNSTLEIDKNTIQWKRCLDMNDRSLRDVSINLSTKTNSYLKTSFNITAASDLMALFCLCDSKADFLEKLSKTIVCYSKSKKPITVADLELEAAIGSILNDAFFPNLVRTNEFNPVLVHGGPFANIAHGCSSILAGNMALKMSDVVVTECGFGSESGLEKFMNITCQVADWNPNLVCLIISLKSILFHAKSGLKGFEAIKSGFENALHHIEHIKMYGIDFICVINKRPEDTKKDLHYLMSLIKNIGIDVEISNAWAKGSKGTLLVANIIKNKLSQKTFKKYQPLYKVDEPLMLKIEKIAKKAYGAKGIKLSKIAKNKLKQLRREDYYICIAKNPYSLTCLPNLLGRPKNFYTTIEDIEVNEAANLLIPITSVIYRMPGLPKTPAAKNFVMK